MNKQVRIFVLNANDFRENVVYRLEKGMVLRFVLGPGLMGHRIRLFTNHPSISDADWTKDEFRELEFIQVSKHLNDDLDRYADITCVQSGPFRYFFLMDTDCIDSPCGSGYFLVDPTLIVGNAKTVLPLDCVQCQTYLTKLLGPFPEWESRLRVAKESGYNMVHLTPIQHLGISNSSYSIADPLKFNPAVAVTPNKTYTFEDLDVLLAKMRNEWGILTVTDVVWNHAAENSDWLKKHPESAYNVLNSPHLRPAYLLDRALKLFGNDVAANKYAHRGLPAVICEGHHLDAMRNILYEDILPPLKLHEFFQVNSDHLADQFFKAMQNREPHWDHCDTPLTIIQDPEYRRFHSTVDISLALRIFYRKRDDCHNVDLLHRSVAEFRGKLLDLNNAAAGLCWSHLSAAVDALLGHVRYQRVNPFGPCHRDYTEHHLLFTEYFTHFDEDCDMASEEIAMYDTQQGPLHMAHNGWVMNDDPLGNFADPDRMVYLRRELICWGDSVKLRYGSRREDCEFLWDLMTEYTEQTARLFNGIRIDNCHSTPVHVAEYLLQKARKIRPDIYVVAELFTGSEHLDNLFVNRLGITSLIREAMSAPDAHEEGRLVHRYGGLPVGAFIQPNVQPIAPILAHALFMDQTHDNPSPVQKRTVFDLLPSAALVSMACCATGSTRGYDELVPYHVDVVLEKRLYATFTEAEETRPGSVNKQSGIIRGKHALNELHCNMGKGGFTQVYVDQLTDDTVSVTRHNPSTHQSVILVARTAFYKSKGISYISPLVVPGVVDEILFEAKLRKKSDEVGDHSSSGSSGRKSHRSKKKVVSEAEQKYILGLAEYVLEFREHVKLCASEMVEIHARDDGAVNDVDFVDFTPGSVIALSVSTHRIAKQGILNIRQGLVNFDYQVRTFSGKKLETGMKRAIELENLLEQMSLRALNRALFRCHPEEVDEGFGGVYNVPKSGELTYCGLQGVMTLLNDIRARNDLGHPLCQNLRDGNWLMDYLYNRLLSDPETKELGLWLKVEFDNLRIVPHYLKPCYFDAVIASVHSSLIEAVFSNMSQFVQDASDFVKALALCSVIFMGVSPSAALPPLSPSIKLTSTGLDLHNCTTLAAGFPHFANGLFRNWGRDTFISLPGLALITGRFDEARCIILAYGGALRHGLIPNLLGGGTHARYNCRDAVWWWLHSIKLYCDAVPDGVDILLNDPVLRLFPTDDSVAGESNKEEPLHATMQEALHRHFEGIRYRERNAGRDIDEYMTDEGFNVAAGVNYDTGFVYGGNQWNCGTWMDKMGCSDKTRTRGKPATPRDGSAVELVGLCAEITHWLAGLVAMGKYPYPAVSTTADGKKITWTWSQWFEKIRENFEPNYWIPVSDSLASIDAKYVNQRGIYKDTYGSQLPWTDYQLRPNFTIAVTVAPELFDAEHAWLALQKVEQHLMGPLGMKTLDPSDWWYDGDYDNADDSTNEKRARGFNYHQGPEWLWVVGYFFRAKLLTAHRLKLAKGAEGDELFAQTVWNIQRRLAPYWTHMQQSPWRALPELTNTNGTPCRDSCVAQAWSVACLLEVVADLHKLCSNTK